MEIFYSGTLAGFAQRLGDHVARNRFAVAFTCENEMRGLDVVNLGACSLDFNISENRSHGVGEWRGLRD